LQHFHPFTGVALVQCSLLVDALNLHVKQQKHAAGCNVMGSPCCRVLCIIVANVRLSPLGIWQQGMEADVWMHDAIVHTHLL
jgi:hypothetical protein